MKVRAVFCFCSLPSPEPRQAGLFCGLPRSSASESDIPRRRHGLRIHAGPVFSCFPGFGGCAGSIGQGLLFELDSPPGTVGWALFSSIAYAPAAWEIPALCCRGIFGDGSDPHRWEQCRIRVWDELRRLHPDEKIRNGSKLDTVNIFSQGLCFRQSAAVQ